MWQVGHERSIDNAQQAGHVQVVPQEVDEMNNAKYRLTGVSSMADRPRGKTVTPARTRELESRVRTLEAQLEQVCSILLARWKLQGEMEQRKPSY